MTTPAAARAVHALRIACQTLDRSAIDELLAADVVAVIDGGGDVIAPLDPVRGMREVASELLAVLSPLNGAVVAERVVNGEPGLVVWMGDRAAAVVGVELRGGLVAIVWISRNPRKLRHWTRSE